MKAIRANESSNEKLRKDILTIKGELSHQVIVQSEELKMMKMITKMETNNCIDKITQNV